MAGKSTEPNGAKEAGMEVAIALVFFILGFGHGYCWMETKRRWFSNCEHDWIPEGFADWKCSKCGVDR